MRHRRRLPAIGIVAVLASFSAEVLPAGSNPDLNGGIWRLSKPTADVRKLVGKLPPLLPDALAVYQQNLAARQKGKLDFDSMERCNAPGIPRLLLQNQPFEFLQRDDLIFIRYQWNRLIRVVEMGKSHSELAGPLLLGQSVGNWNGRTLLVDSTGFTDKTLLDDFGMPHSEQLHVAERYTLDASGRALTLNVTVDDPGSYARPWSFHVRYVRDMQARIDEDICVERKDVVFWQSKNK